MELDTKDVGVSAVHFPHFRHALGVILFANDIFALPARRPCSSEDRSIGKMGEVKG